MTPSYILLSTLEISILQSNLAFTSYKAGVSTMVSSLFEMDKFVCYFSFSKLFSQTVSRTCFWPAIQSKWHSRRWMKQFRLTPLTCTCLYNAISAWHYLPAHLPRSAYQLQYQVLSKEAQQPYFLE